MSADPDWMEGASSTSDAPSVAAPPGKSNKSGKGTAPAPLAAGKGGKAKGTYAQRSGYKERLPQKPQDQTVPTADAELTSTRAWRIPRPEDPCPELAAAQLQQLRHWQQTRLPKMLKEDLLKNGRKEKHWIWWAFPCDMPGDCEPKGDYAETTRLTIDTAIQLVGDVPEIWREVLEKVCELERAERARKPYLGMYHRGSALPSEDHSRVVAFVEFWERVPVDSRPDWLNEVVAHLKGYRWC